MSEQLHKDIYLQILSPYALLAKNSFFASLGRYTKEQRRLLRNHCSRMVEALVLIADCHLSTATHTISPAELSIINRYLIRGLLEIYRDMPWIHAASAVHAKHTEIDDSPLIEVTETEVTIISPEAIIERLRSVNSRLTAERDTAAARADLLSEKVDGFKKDLRTLTAALTAAGLMPAAEVPESTGEPAVVVRIAASGGPSFFSPTAGTAAAAGAGVGMGIELPAARAGADAR